MNLDQSIQDIIDIILDSSACDATQDVSPETFLSVKAIVLEVLHAERDEARAWIRKLEREKETAPNAQP